MIRAIKAVLLDYDGVIIDSIGEMYIGSCNVFKNSGLPEPSFGEFRKTYEAPYLDYYRRYGVVASDDIVKKWYFEKAKNERAPIFQDIPHVVRILKSRGIILGIVSAHNARSIESRLRTERLASSFSFIAGEAHTKDQTIIKFCGRFRIKPEEVLFVGDLASDMRDGKKAGVVTVAFTVQHDIQFPFADYHIRHLTQLFELIGKR